MKNKFVYKVECDCFKVDITDGCNNPEHNKIVDFESLTHKEKMNWYKENEPIIYYELTSDPTGVGGEDSLFDCIMTVFIIVIIVGFCYLLTL